LNISFYDIRDAWTITLDPDSAFPRGQQAGIVTISMRENCIEFAQETHPPPSQIGESGSTADLHRTPAVFHGSGRFGVPSWFPASTLSNTFPRI
jgi:hypothetical protein